MVEVIVGLIDVYFSGSQFFVELPLKSGKICYLVWIFASSKYAINNPPVLPVHGIRGSLVVRVLLRAARVSPVRTVGLQHRDVGETERQRSLSTISRFMFHINMLSMTMMKLLIHTVVRLFRVKDTRLIMSLTLLVR